MHLLWCSPMVLFDMFMWVLHSGAVESISHSKNKEHTSNTWGGGSVLHTIKYFLFNLT